MRVIAIDGPVGAGKSTVAQALADRLGLPMLSTGAMYRAVALAAVRRGLDVEHQMPAVAALAPRVTVDVGERVRLDGEDVTGELRNDDVNRVVSLVAADPGVRRALVSAQRAWAEAHGGGVVEGRDIGTVVFPDAAVKVFLTASSQERARRRGGDEDAAGLARRDHLDSTRATSPLVAAPDALIIDSTDLTVAEIVGEIAARWNA